MEGFLQTLGEEVGDVNEGQNKHITDLRGQN